MTTTFQFLALTAAMLLVISGAPAVSAGKARRQQADLAQALGTDTAPQTTAPPPKDVLDELQALLEPQPAASSDEQSLIDALLKELELPPLAPTTAAAETTTAAAAQDIAITSTAAAAAETTAAAAEPTIETTATAVRRMKKKL